MGTESLFGGQQKGFLLDVKASADQGKKYHRKHLYECCFYNRRGEKRHMDLLQGKTKNKTVIVLTNYQKLREELQLARF